MCWYNSYCSAFYVVPYHKLSWTLTPNSKSGLEYVHLNRSEFSIKNLWKWRIELKFNFMTDSHILIQKFLFDKSILIRVCWIWYSNQFWLIVWNGWATLSIIKLILLKFKKTNGIIKLYHFSKISIVISGHLQSRYSKSDFKLRLQIWVKFGSLFIK